MKYLAMLTVVAAALIGGATARNCTPKLYYCGYVLKEIATGSNYDAQINDALAANGQPRSEANNSLFYCSGGANGEIWYIGFCNKGCVDKGTGNSDTCA